MPDSPVQYRETIRRSATGSGRFIRQTATAKLFAMCDLRIEPLPRGEGFLFENRLTLGHLPESYFEAVREGVTEGITHGILAGYPIIDIKVDLVNGAYHETDSTEAAFFAAAKLALQEAVTKSNPVLLEPILRIVVHVPESSVGDLVSDLEARKGVILDLQSGPICIVEAKLPEGQSSGFEGQWASVAAMVRSRFAHYAEVEPPPEDGGEPIGARVS